MADKPFEPDDPLALVGVAIEADAAAADAMARCLVEEYLREGWTPERLLALCRNPFYRALHAIYRERGEDGMRAVIAEAAATWGVWRTTAGGAQTGRPGISDAAGGPDDA
jgi:hypothetical protein